MKRVMLIGRTGAGKTTLIQALEHQALEYYKTQEVHYMDKYIDTPGEYSENRWMRGCLQVTGTDADLVALVHGAGDTQAVFANNYRYFFTQPCIGIVTKTDLTDGNPNYAKEQLILAGIPESDIYFVSAYTGEGLETLRKVLESVNIQ